MSVTESSLSSSDSAKEEEEEEEDAELMKAVCECGRELESGWNCNNCRRQCSICNRSLSTDPDDYCERCFKKCEKHGLFRNQNVTCPKCP